MKKILILQSHPNPESFCVALGQAYKSTAITNGAEVQEIVIPDLNFDPNLSYGYSKRMELEPDLLQAWEKIQWADHIVFIHPLWWGGIPALAKGFFDRLFLPGMAFQKREGSLWWDKLLKGKSARIIATMDQPVWFYWLFNKAPSHRALKKMTFEFVGIKPVSITSIGPIRLSTDEFRAKWISKINKIALKES
ncbi:Putative NADPH-quinone reductase (modulator of drug activity B) [Spirosomataceae bacterium TFI 002]|nr:Putative NADPH-quinone reductase (modulator of drug activity B) [Spirosomataceae bacterium TFI 002]